MNYVILSTDGSVQETSLAEYIQKGSDKANHVKVAYADSRRDGLAARLHCELPNGDRISIVGTADYFNYKDSRLLGWDFPLSLASTLYEGALSCSLTITDASNSVLVQYPFTLTVNDSAYPDDGEDFETRITIEEYNQLFNYIQSIKGDIVIVDSYGDLPAIGFGKTLYVVKKDGIAEGYVWKDGYLKITDRDFAIECLEEAKEYTDQVAETTLESANEHADEVAQYQANQERERAISEEERIEAKLDDEISERESEIERVDGRVTQEANDRSQAVSSLESAVQGKLDLKENLSNKTSSIGAGSDDEHYPSAKAVNDFVNSSINSLAAYYITKNAQGDAFETYAELSSATMFYSGGALRTPTRNDYCIVRSDENHSNATTRYTYNNGWEYQYTVNDEPFTQAQLSALNSGITEAKVESYDQGLDDIQERIKYSDASIAGGGFIGGFNIDGIYRKVTNSLEIAFVPKIVNAVSDLTNADRDFLYMVKANRHLYYWNGTQWEDLGLYNQDYVLVLDITDNLTTQATNKPLSAKQGYELEQKKLNISDIQYATLSDLPNIFGGTR